MTNSTIDSKAQNKGPLRLEAILPVTLIFLGAFLYFHFLFDSHVRKAIEWAGTYVHGAEVNVGSLRTSFLEGSFSLKNLQVMDKNEPKRNLIQIGEIHFAFLWDALLRAKFVVSKAGIDGIQVYSPRKRPGSVRPPEPPSKEPSALAKLESNVLEQTKEDHSGNALGDVASLLDGSDEKDILKNIQGQLQAEAHIKALQDELKAKEKLWKERLESLPKKEEFQELAQRAKALKFNSKDPKQFAADVKELGKITKDADAKIDELKNTSGNLKSDIEKFNNEFKRIDELIQQDIKDIEARLKIPDLNLEDFSKSIFGKMFADKLVSLQKYMEIGRKYMPPPKDPNAPKEKELIPPPRGAGKNYDFPVTKGYPLFWLKHASISSKSTKDGFSGDVSGELTNVTTSPKAIGRPAVLNVKGDFPKSEIYNTHLKVIVDHIAEPRESLELVVGLFPLLNQKLVSSSSLSLAAKKASGTSRIVAELKNRSLSVDLRNEFKQVEYDLQAKSKKAQEVVSSILNGIPMITLNASARGSWDNLSLHINSNLGKELSSGLKRYVQAKVDELKQKVRAQVDGKIKDEKNKLTQEYNKLRAQVDRVLKSKTEELDKAKKEVKSQAQSTKSSSQDKLKDELKEKGKKLLKGIKF